MANFGNSDPSLNEARIATEIQRAEKFKLENAKAVGALVDREAAERAVFTYARSIRDGLLSWVTRSAPIIASELNTTETAAFRCIDKLMREYLIESANGFSLIDNGTDIPCDPGCDAARHGPRSSDDGERVGRPV